MRAAAFIRLGPAEGLHDACELTIFREAVSGPCCARYARHTAHVHSRLSAWQQAIFASSHRSAVCSFQALAHASASPDMPGFCVQFFLSNGVALYAPAGAYFQSDVSPQLMQLGNFTTGLAVQILPSSLCGCNRQFCSLVPPMPVRCGLQPQLALALSGIFSSFRGPSSAEPAVSRKVFLWTQYFRSCNRCVGMTSGGGGSLVSDRLWLRLIQALYTA